VQGVVSPLDDEHAGRMQALWQALRQEFGTEGLHPSPLPHLTYHAAERYDMERLEAAVKSLARSLPPFDIATNGIGVFTGERRIVYLPVVRHSRLTVLQRAVAEQVSRLGEGASEVWAPDNWVPHLSVAALPPEDGRLGTMVEWLCGQDLGWTIPIGRLAIGEDTGEGQRFTFEATFEA